jgi:hypothetical protein
MMRSAALVVVLTACLAEGLSGQQPVSLERARAVYTVVLESLPAEVAGREVLVDPRVARAFFDNAEPMEVWEQHLRSAASDPAVRSLEGAVEGLRYCADTPTRSRCLTSTRHVHVTFSTPVRTNDGSIVVEATFATRTFDDRNAFMIQTWRFSLVQGTRGLTLAEREFQGRGHGRLGDHDPAADVQTGQRIRVVAPEFDYQRRTGTHGVTRGDTLYMEVSGSRHAVALSGLRSIEVSVGRDHWRGALYGGTIGALGAGVIMGLLHAASGPGDYGSTEGSFAYGFIIGAPAGLLIGVPVGAVIGVERWLHTSPRALQRQR